MPEKASAEAPSTPMLRSHPIYAKDTLNTWITQASSAAMPSSSSEEPEDSTEDQMFHSTYASASQQTSPVSVTTAEAEDAVESAPYALQDSR